VTCTITSEANGEAVVVHVVGEVDVDGAALLRQALAGAIGAGFVDLVVDLRLVTFIDSTGLGVLVGALRNVRRHGGQLQIVVSDPRLVRLLRISSLDQLFVVHDDVAAALLPTQRPERDGAPCAEDCPQARPPSRPPSGPPGRPGAGSVS
jgi:anti-sigma B factor antagonist